MRVYAWTEFSLLIFGIWWLKPFCLKPFLSRGGHFFSGRQVPFPCQLECNAPQGMEHSAGARWLVASGSRTPTSHAEVAQRTPARVTWWPESSVARSTPAAGSTCYCGPRHRHGNRSSPSDEVGSRNAGGGGVRPSVPGSFGSIQENPRTSPGEACSQVGCSVASRGESQERQWPQQNASWVSKKTGSSKRKLVGVATGGEWDDRVPAAHSPCGFCVGVDQVAEFRSEAPAREGRSASSGCSSVRCHRGSHKKDEQIDLNTVAGFSVVFIEPVGLVARRRGWTRFVNHDGDSHRPGLRGVRVGEASHPGPPVRRMRRLVQRNGSPRSAPRATQVDSETDEDMLRVRQATSVAHAAPEVFPMSDDAGVEVATLAGHAAVGGPRRVDVVPLSLLAFLDQFRTTQHGQVAAGLQCWSLGVGDITTVWGTRMPNPACHLRGECLHGLSLFLIYHVITHELIFQHPPLNVLLRFLHL